MFREWLGCYHSRIAEVEAMRSVLVASSIALVLFSTLAHAGCGTDVVIIKGRVEHPSHSAIVRVQLVYRNQRLGESGEVTLDHEKFTIQIPFLTQSRAPLLIGSFRQKCERKPKTVVVTLLESDQDREYDRVSLNLIQDFKMADPSAYTLKSEIVLSAIH
jgi:hypothetical protein